MASSGLVFSLESSNLSSYSPILMPSKPTPTPPHSQALINLTTVMPADESSPFYLCFQVTQTFGFNFNHISNGAVADVAPTGTAYPSRDRW